MAFVESSWTCNSDGVRSDFTFELLDCSMGGFAGDLGECLVQHECLHCLPYDDHDGNVFSIWSVVWVKLFLTSADRMMS